MEKEELTQDEKMIERIFCKLCEEIINQDRCNVNFNIDRQDFPHETKWQSSSDFFLHDICFSCYERLLKALRLEKEKIKESQKLICKYCKEKIEPNSSYIKIEYPNENIIMYFDSWICIGEFRKGFS